MALFEIASGVLLAPFILFISMILLLAGFGKSFGIRRLYVRLLLRLFEFGKQNIESARRNSTSSITYDSEEEEPEVYHQEKPVNGDVPNKKNGLTKKLSQNGHINNNGNTVITKESLTLMPDDVACNESVAAVEVTKMANSILKSKIV